jgi:hypothetical protein
MVILYEICIWMAWFMERKEANREAEEKEREKKLLIEQIRSEKEIQEKEGRQGGKSKEIGTLEYDPDNAVVYEDENRDEIKTSDDSAAFDEYHTGLDENANAVDPKSDAVWGYSDEAKGGKVPEDSDTYHDDHHYDHGYHDDQGYYSDGYYSGPTEELKRKLREELRDDLKQEIIQEIKDEIKTELKSEIIKELSSNDGSNNP